MKIKFEEIKEKYITLGVEEKNYEYALNAVKSGTKKDFIIKNLTSDVRKMDYSLASNMLDEMFQANGGEFKYENRGGYLYSAFYLVAIIVLTLLIFSMNEERNNLRIKLSVALLAFLFLFFRTLIPAIKGKFRE